MMSSDTTQTIPSDAWCLRYASHLGYRSPETPLFACSARDSGPLAQVDFAAELGLAGVQYALACGSSVADPIAVAAEAPTARSRHRLHALRALRGHSQPHWAAR